MKYDGISLVRIDDRLIHGQVMTSWLNYIGSNKILVIDDSLAQDQFMINVLKTCVPGNVKLAVMDVENAVKRIEKGFAGDKCIILVKFPSTLKQLLDAGIIFDEINIGGMGIIPGRKAFYKSISASDAEKQIFKELIGSGSRMKIRIVSEDSEVDISKLL